MSFTLDIPGNCVRFTSPPIAGRLANYARDPRCSVLFSRDTAGYPPVLIQGVAVLGEVAPGVVRGPARRFIVTPEWVTVLDTPLQRWRLPPAPPAGPLPDAATQRPHGQRPLGGGPALVAPADLDALLRFPANVATLRDAAGRPVAMPVDLACDGGVLSASLPDLGDATLVSGPASLLGHTWSKAGPRYLALTGDADVTAGTLRFRPSRVLRRGEP